MQGNTPAMLGHLILALAIWRSFPIGGHFCKVFIVSKQNEASEPGTITNMNRWIVAAGGLVVAAAITQSVAHLNGQNTGPHSKPGFARLHNNWELTPAGTTIALPGDMPVGSAFTADGRYMFVNTCGYHGHSVSVVDIATEKVVQSYDLGRNWIGLAFDDRSGVLYISGGSSSNYKRAAKEAAPSSEILPTKNWGPVLRLKFTDGHLSPMDPLKIDGLSEKERFVSSILVESSGNLLVANIQNDTVYRVNPESGQVIASAKVGYRPYGLALSPDGKTLAVTNWGDKSVSLLNLASLEVQGKVDVGAHPNALAYAKDGRLFVANAGSNTISVIEGGKVVDAIRTSLVPGDPIGTTPIALTLAADGNQLFVANADNNDVAVVSIKGADSHVQGFIPTGRYPSLVRLTPDGTRLLIGTGKGLNDLPSASQEQINSKTAVRDDEASIPYTYVGSLLRGDLAFVNLPTAKELVQYTKQVVSNRPQPKIGPADKALLKTLQTNIQHVIYVVKENRTYDQVLGDVPQGNGEPKLTIFGAKITPNEHQLVNDFVLLDNLYTDGEVSQVGHQWTDGAYANDYTEKQWTQSYSGRGEVDSDDRMFTSPAGYLWQNMQKHGKTTRIYGEYIQWQEDHNAAHGDVKKDPEKYGCSAAFEKVFGRGGRDTEKVAVFIKEMKQAELSGKWPNFMIMALNEDHTKGSRPGAHTPAACVASNDLSVGQLVDAVSHSQFWKSTAIFVIEDDAQSGPDHVDCHRTTGYLASAWLKRKYVDHHQYSTTSMIRTMEMLLNVPTFTQYDTAAYPMLASFQRTPDLTPWNAVPASAEIDKMNPESGELARRSMKLDLSDIDRADEQEFNKILWEAMKPGVPMPAPVHGFR